MDEVTSVPGRRGVGRPSTVVRHTAAIAEWLSAEPGVSSADILRRLRLIGYRGGKSALYELVKRLRASSRRPSHSEHPRASGE